MRKKTHEEIAAAFATEGYTLLDKFEDIFSKMRYNCPEGHQHEMSWRSFKKGIRCAHCATENRKLTHEEVEAVFKSEGYTLLDKYENPLAKMRSTCPNGHEYEIQWYRFNQGSRCSHCSRKSRKKSRAEEVKAAFAREGYTLLDKYEDAHKKMRYICPEGHQHEINWTNFDQGYRCAYCAGQIVTHEMVGAAFAAEGYQLLDRYEHGKKKMKFICPQGHHYQICWSNFNTGYRCAHCAGRIVTHEEVEKAFTSEGYQLLTKYQRNTTKLDFICPNNHRHTTTWANFRSGVRCAYCRNLKIDEETVKAAFEAEGYTLLSQYKNSSEKLKYVCPSGHKSQIAWYSFKSGNRCAYCAGKIITHGQVELAFALEGFQLLDEYVNSNTKMRYICPEGHQHSIVWDAFKQGVRCPYCAGMKPSEEQRKINEIKYGIARLIQIYLRNQFAKKPYSITTFAGAVARQVFEALGVRPEGYHLDHIVPQSYFDFRNAEEIEACWHIENLRYLPASVNAGRGNRLSLPEVKQFTETQKLILGKASLRPKKFDKYLALQQTTNSFGSSNKNTSKFNPENCIQLTLWDLMEISQQPAS